MTWEELFFDLTLVFALTQLSRVLHDDPSWAGIGRVLILFVLIYWVWVAATYYCNQRDVSNAVDRLGLFALALGNLLLGLMIPGAYHDRALSLVSVYLAIRVLLAVLGLRTNRRILRSLFSGPYTVGLVTGPLQLAGGLVGGMARPLLWAVAAVIDLSSPWIARRALSGVSVRPAHYAHRYGLLIILVLGESVIQVGAVAADLPLTVVRTTAIGTAFTLVCALWWAYFVYGVRTFRQALERADAVDIRRSVMIYGHLSFGFAIIMIAVGLAEVVSAPLEPLPAGEAGLLCAGCALFVATFAYTYWRIHRKIAWRRVGAGAGCLILLPLALFAPALVALAALTVVVVGVNLLEDAIARRHRASDLNEAFRGNGAGEAGDRERFERSGEQAGYRSASERLVFCTQTAGPSGCHEPLVDLVERLAETCREVCRHSYGTRAWVDTTTPISGTSPTWWPSIASARSTPSGCPSRRLAIGSRCSDRASGRCQPDAEGPPARFRRSRPRPDGRARTRKAARTYRQRFATTTNRAPVTSTATASSRTSAAPGRSDRNCGNNATKKTAALGFSTVANQDVPRCRIVRGRRHPSCSTGLASPSPFR